jgi:hypothetical protein
VSDFREALAEAPDEIAMAAALFGDVEEDAEP